MLTADKLSEVERALNRLAAAESALGRLLDDEHTRLFPLKARSLMLRRGVLELRDLQRDLEELYA